MKNDIYVAKTLNKFMNRRESEQQQAGSSVLGTTDALFNHNERVGSSSPTPILNADNPKDSSQQSLNSKKSKKSSDLAKLQTRVSDDRNMPETDPFEVEKRENGSDIEKDEKEELEFLSEYRPPKPHCIIMEDNKYKQYWDLYIGVLILYVALFVPYRMAVEAKDTIGWLAWGYTVDGSFFVDIVLTFFTSFYDDIEMEQIT